MPVSVETKSETKSETVVTPQVDKHLAELYAQRDESEAKTSTLFGEICDHVRKNLCTFGKDEQGKQTVTLHPNVRLTLQAPKSEGGRGLAKESVSVELSRIKAMMFDKNQGTMSQLVRGLVTQAEARKLAKVGSTRGRISDQQREEDKTPAEQYTDTLTKLARQVVNNLQSKTEEEFVADCRKAFQDMKAEKATLDAKKASGAIQGGTPVVPANQGGFQPQPQAETPAQPTVKGGRRAA